MVTIAADALLGEVRNAVTVFEASRSSNGLGAQLVSSSSVMVEKGGPLGPTNWVSLSYSTISPRSSSEDLLDTLTRRKVAPCVNAFNKPLSLTI